ncbi:MAG: DUF2723 domain-containing protein [Bacteroidales bacterium]|nr:DUF2723 domain-containing protein [Bacteroidales bacterium]
MSKFKLTNNVVGWLVFAIAAFTYCATVEPTASFWDCPEFITSAFKLEVGHPPGAPFFMLMGNLFSQFTDDVTKVALMVNYLTAIMSAFCILFLFWSITHLARKLLTENGTVETMAQTLLIMGCGITGALAYTWSDTFWFSAVEGEVYGTSSMFTALVFWLILKWEDHADEAGSDRWLILIFYLMGLSIGVHLLNLLCLPAIGLVYYYKRHPEAQTKGSLVALAVSFLVIVAVLYGVVPGLVKVGGWFELFAVNTMGFGFNAGMVIYVVVLVAVVLTAVWSTLRSDRTLMKVLYTLSVALLGIPFIGEGWVAVGLGVVLLGLLYYALGYKGKDGNYFIRKRFLNTSLLCMLMLMIGYSSYAVIMVRSAANTPMDQNSPEDIFTLGSYLSRDQYGYRPLGYGQAYTSQPVAMGKKMKVQKHEKQNPAEPDMYDEVEVNDNYIYPSGTKMFFPRMYDASKARQYESWLGGIDLTPVEFYVEDPQTGAQQGPYMGQMPSQWDNLRFLTSYQLNFMYWRYFMWNFAGRQNDIQGHGTPDKGNWITGISFIDNALYGDQSLLPDVLKNNKGHNVFYCLPLLLGLLGMFWQAFRGDKGVKQFWVTFFLFFMTGIAIVLYLNQTPSQPRERDYAYAGSFYAFAIWIGLGVAAIAEGIKKLLKGKNELVPATLASVLGILVPLQMVSQTWDDHDRSDRYACRDFGGNYLSTLDDGNAPIIFTNGDNDTFPLWYSQEVEGMRTDARVCNLSYLQTDWYTDQMRRPAYNSPALPIAWERYEYVDNMGHDVFYIKPERKSELDAMAASHPGENVYSLKFIIDNFVRKGKGIPTDSVVVPVNKENVIKSGMALPGGKDSIPEHITISFKGKEFVTKSEMMIYEMLVRSDWKRPLYMSVTLGEDNYAGLGDYLVLEGLAYRITPFKQSGAIDADRMYKNMMERFRYGNVASKNVYLDETVLRMCRTHRMMFSSLVRALLDKGEKAKAIKALTKMEEVLPFSTIPFEPTDLNIGKLWLDAGNKAKAESYALMGMDYAKGYINWANSYIGDFNPTRQSLVQEGVARAVMTLSNAVQMLSTMKSAKANALATEGNALLQTPAAQVGLELLQPQQQQAPAVPAPSTGGAEQGIESPF